LSASSGARAVLYRGVERQAEEAAAKKIERAFPRIGADLGATA
jgi:hypothetical protein